PEGIALSSLSIPENQASGTLVGYFATTNPNNEDSFTYSLVAGTGSEDNGSFSVNGNSLRTTASFNYESRNSYSIRVRTTGPDGSWFERTFTLAVLDASEPPQEVTLSNLSISENQRSGSLVGSLTTTDPDVGNTFSYALVAGPGGEDNGSFAVSGNSLRTAASFNYESRNRYSVRLRTTDQGGLWLEKSFNLAVLDAAEPPEGISLSNLSVPEKQVAGTLVGAFTTADPDIADTFTYALVPGAGSEDNASFTINQDTLRTAASFDYDRKSALNIRVKSLDKSGLYFERSFAISVTEVAEKPAAPVNTWPESGAFDQPVSITLRASPFSDPDTNDTHFASQWRVKRTHDSVVVFDSGEDTLNKTECQIPLGWLRYSVNYAWQVRYKDNR
ncbi:cadherin repeat domain-containing protein, partial [bacterium]|nr:cadherin repeat domain-containing protein [bacterium]